MLMQAIARIRRGWSYEATIPYLKPSSLDDLHGPTTGCMTVDANITTAPTRTFDLSALDERLWLYEQTVRDGLPSQQASILNKVWLAALWPELNLPVRCRAEWEDAFPELAR